MLLWRKPQMKRQIVNIINFIRDCEPREWRTVDLFESVREQVRLMRELGLKGTFLLQYDALIDPIYTELLKQLDPEQFELGVWHEIVEPECIASGIDWRGRYPWDWHAHCGFSVGYTKEQRERICDTLFEKFREVFGDYPRVFGSWLFDSHTLNYASDKYGLDAACICKEQYGTDGYTLWGGYYGQGYYPSRKNYFMPAQTEAEQLEVPIFRMLGSDPVYQYDFGMDVDSDKKSAQGVITLEPVYTGTGGGGAVPHWVDWYLKENFNGECLSFGYTQVGQENSFRWDEMKDGLTYQFEQLAKLQRDGALEVEPLGTTGRWFKNTYALTPASAISAHTAYDTDDKSSFWYSSRFYRANVYSDGALRFRDIHVFSEAYPDDYNDTVCTSNAVEFDTLPVVDGNRNSGNGVVAGLYLTAADGSPIKLKDYRFTELDHGSALLDYGQLTVKLCENGIQISANSEFCIDVHIGVKKEHIPTIVAASDDVITLSYRGMQYGIRLIAGRFENEKKLCSEDGVIAAEFCKPVILE